MVCPGIERSTSEKLGFIPAETPQEGIDRALSMAGPGAKVIVLKNGGDILPLYSPR